MCAQCDRQWPTTLNQIKWNRRREFFAWQQNNNSWSSCARPYRMSAATATVEYRRRRIAFCSIRFPLIFFFSVVFGDGVCALSFSIAIEMNCLSWVWRVCAAFSTYASVADSVDSVYVLCICTFATKMHWRSFSSCSTVVVRGAKIFFVLNHHSYMFAIKCVATHNIHTSHTYANCERNQFTFMHKLNSFSRSLPANGLCIRREARLCVSVCVCCPYINCSGAYSAYKHSRDTEMETVLHTDISALTFG